jgi:hypothetical protein
VGKDEIARGFRGRFEGIPDVRYDEDRHFVAGDRGVSELRLRGTTTDGTEIDVRGCDLMGVRGRPHRAEGPVLEDRRAVSFTSR